MNTSKQNNSNGSSHPKVKKGFNPLPNAEIIRFSNEFTKEFFVSSTGEMENVPMDAIRIIFKIASDLRNSQFQNKNETQLELFDTVFLNEHNTFATFVINLNDISLNKNTNRVKKALEFLVDFKRDWYTVTNKEGKKVKSYGGLISTPSYMKGMTSFMVPVYWLNKLSYINQYNQTFFNLAFNVSNNKHIFFFFWIVTLPDEGTTVNFQTINNKFKLNYSSAKELCKGFLKNVKRSLDKEANISFNYSYKQDRIHIINYIVNVEKIKAPVLKKSVSISQRTHYWKRRHQLSEVHITTLKFVLKNDNASMNLLNNAYEILKKQCKTSGRKTTEVIGEEFMNLFQMTIIEAYKDTKMYQITKNGYPKIK